MPKPITVYYGEKPVTNVYQSELQYHLNNGASLVPLILTPVEVETPKKERKSKISDSEN